MARLPVSEKSLKDGTRVVLRSPEPIDAEKLLETVREIMARSEHLLTQADEFKYTVDQETTMITTFLAHPTDLLIVPEVSGRIVGLLDFKTGGRKRNAHTGEFGISLLPEFQGRGLGRLIIEALITWTTANPSVEKLLLRVHAKNTGAIELYSKLGFKIEGREVRGVKLGSSLYDDVISMARDVGNTSTHQ